MAGDHREGYDRLPRFPFGFHGGIAGSRCSFSSAVISQQLVGGWGMRRVGDPAQPTPSADRPNTKSNLVRMEAGTGGSAAKQRSRAASGLLRANVVLHLIQSDIADLAGVYGIEIRGHYR